MSTSLAPYPKFRHTSLAGVPSANYKLYTYQAGTTTPLATYKDNTLSNANTNPVILNSDGECDLWLTDDVYKLTLKTDLDVLVWEVDNVTSYGYAIKSLKDLLASSTGTQTMSHSYPQAPAYLKTVSDILNGDEVSIDRFLSQAEINAVRNLSNTTNVATALSTAVNAATFLLLPYGLYNTNAGLSISGKDCSFYGLGKIKYTGSNNVNAVLTVTNPPNFAEIGALYFDAGGFAQNGVSIELSSSVPDHIWFNKTQGGNTADDTATESKAVIRVIDLGGAGGTHRPQNVYAKGIKTFSCGTHGFLPAYCDNVNLYGGARFYLAHNHGWEAVNCKGVIATQWGGIGARHSGGAIGDGTINATISNFFTSGCGNDASLSIEHNCQNVNVSEFILTKCFQSGLNISFGDASNGNGNIKDITIKNGKIYADVSNVVTPGINCYGSTGSGLSDNVRIKDVTCSGFNRGADYLFQKNGEIDITTANLTGSGTYAIKGQLVKNCSIKGRCDDTTLDHAYQVIGYAGTPSSDCVIEAQVTQAGAASEKAVVTIDGAGSGFVVTAHTNSAGNYLYVQAGAQCSLVNSTGNLTDAPWAGVCNPISSQGNANSIMDFSVVGGIRIFSATNNAGAPNFTGRIPPNATPYFRDGDKAVPPAYTSATPKEWAYKVSTTTWVSQGNFA